MAHILIVDDDPAILDLMAEILKNSGHRISTSRTGLETLHTLGLEPENTATELPDLILLDVMMPQSDGYTVATVIRNREQTRKIPIVLVSALEKMSPLFEATVKIQGFLTKPFTPQQLLTVVAKTLAA